MVLGTGFENAGEDVDASEASEAPRARRVRLGVHRAPTMPRPSPPPGQTPDPSPRPPGPEVPVGENLSDVTGRLCAASYLRPDHAAAVARVCARCGRVALRALWIVLVRRGEKRRQALRNLTRRPGAGDDQPRILLGHAYVSWVRRRIAVGRPVPPHGFDLTPVLETAATAEGLTHLRRLLLALSVGAAAVVGVGRGFLPAACVALGGAWAACCADRFQARRRLHRAPCWARRTGRDPRWWVGPGRRGMFRRPPSERDGQVVPYRLNLRRYRSPTHALVGAGKLWSEDAIGIDVAAAVPAENRREESEEERLVRQVFRSVQDMLYGDGKDFVPFTPEELHRHVGDELRKLLDPQSKYLPENRLEVLDVAAVSSDGWSAIDEDEWRALHAMAADGADTAGVSPGTTRARRMLCTRIVSWEGDLVTLLYISFAYEHHYLRITVRPHVVNPVNTRLTGALAAALCGGTRVVGKEALNAFLDVFALLGRLRRPFTRPRPELDDEEIASLREAYSCRHMDDMLQYDDARRYLAWMERCVFRAVLGFLQDRNVDVSAFLSQATHILQNNGVINTGSMGDVQNQPGAQHSSATMNPPAPPQGGH